MFSFLENSKFYYSHFLTLKELLSENFKDVIEKTLKIYSALDNIKGDEKTKIETLLNLIYGELIDNPPDNIYTRYQKYDKDYNLVNVSSYNSNLSKKLYQSFLPLYQQKQLYNASMSWDDINNLLTETNIRTLTNDIKGSSNSKIEGKLDIENETGNYINGQQHGTINYSPEYANGGGKSKGNNKGNQTSDNTFNNNINLKENIEKNNLKLDYLKTLNEIIEKNKFSLTDAFYEFINFIVFPNQNIKFNSFPWPWRFDGEFE